MRNTRLAGHALRGEGKACTAHPTRKYELTHSSRGRGLCSCGGKSPVLTTNGQRQRWHRDHKQAIRDARAAAARQEEQ